MIPVINTLIVWVSKDLRETAEIAVKWALNNRFSIEEKDLKPIDNGFEFLFDDETGGRAKIEFIIESSLAIKITGDYAWEVVALYEMVSDRFEDGDGE